MRRIEFLLLPVLLSAVQAQAGVFNIPNFVKPGEFAVGLEPELTLTSGAGLGGNIKYTQGLTELSNVTGILGTGDGPRRFRVGGSMTFDFFPDIEKQPGIGIALQGLYVRIPDPDTAGETAGQLEITGIPYIHKAFATQGGEVDPFLAIPLGEAFQGGRYKSISQVALGTTFKNSEHLRYVIEFGIAVNNTQSYLSGGLVYYH